MFTIDESLKSTIKEVLSEEKIPMFKVGDRVAAVQYSAHHLGNLGTVVKINKHGHHYVQMDHDKDEIRQFDHRGSGRGTYKSNYGEVNNYESNYLIPKDVYDKSVKDHSEYLERSKAHGELMRHLGDHSNYTRSKMADDQKEHLKSLIDKL